MHQSFARLSETERTPERIGALRERLHATDLDGFVVPRSDEYQNEYVPAAAERLRWLTGFSGSAGLAVILADKAAVFIDGRYVLQVKKEVDLKLMTPLQVPQNDPALWLAETVGTGAARIGFDPQLHSAAMIERWRKTLLEKNPRIELVAVEANPVDAVWSNRPAPAAARIELHPLKFAGVSAADKIAARQKELVEAGLAAFFLTAPASIDWLLNIRGGDVPHTPLALGRAILPASGRVELFIDPAKLTPAVEKRLAGIVDIRSLDAIEARIGELAKTGGKVGIDADNASFGYNLMLTRHGIEVVQRQDPCVLPRAIKNKAEIKGMREAHVRDGAAVSRFLHWLSETGDKGLDEIAAAQRLEAFRQETGALRDISFETISGAGPNGAIVHYRVNEESNRKLKTGELYLVDSGGQYRDGTTDITRTVAIGAPSAEQILHYTLVLKGHIGIASARFPVGTRGVDLDALARIALWKAGLDYDHGTGHGVGAYLGVHEGPQNISKRGMAELVPGMIVSNEPGFYRTGKYGIRIENLVLVTPAMKPAGGERDMLGFETLTLAPLDRNLIDPAQLDEAELAWLDAYQDEVWCKISPLLEDADARTWLRAATRPFGKRPAQPKQAAKAK